MQDTRHSIGDLFPSAVPSEDEVRAWNDLPRDEQLRRLRQALTHPDCTQLSPRSMADILAEARAKADAATSE